MDEVGVASGSGGGGNLSDGSGDAPAWSNVVTDDGTWWPIEFVPPPPRPAFLDDAAATPDGLTTCDLCTWAWRDQRASTFPSLDGTLEAPGELGWVLTLIIVSLISALIGAVIMVTALHWRRLKHTGSRGICTLCSTDTTQQSNSQDDAMRMRQRSPAPPPTPTNKEISTFDNRNDIDNQGRGCLWSLFTSKKSSTTRAQLTTATNTTPAENHYTHMDEPYATADEAVYAELDRDSNSPAYENTAYTGSDIEPDAPVSSAPSSAYYSDLSVITVPERAYEIVGVGSTTGGVAPYDGNGEVTSRRQQPPLPISRLAAISESVVVQASDYV